MMACSTAKSGYCKFFAAACTSAHIRNNLDTALLAVSIVIVPLIVAICT